MPNKLEICWKFCEKCWEIAIVSNMELDIMVPLSFFFGGGEGGRIHRFFSIFGFINYTKYKNHTTYRFQDANYYV